MAAAFRPVRSVAAAGAAPSASTKLRPKAMRAPSTVKKFGVTPATTICSGLASSATNGPGNAAIPAIDSNAVALEFRSSQSPGAIGKSTTFRVRMSDLIKANRSGCTYGRGRNSTAFTTLKIAVVAPTPSAIVTMAVRVKAGWWRRDRTAKPRSLVNIECGVRRRSAVTWDGCGDGCGEESEGGRGVGAGNRRLLRPR